MEEVPFKIAKKKNNADRKQTKRIRIEANFLHEFSKFSTRFGNIFVRISVQKSV